MFGKLLRAAFFLVLGVLMPLHHALAQDQPGKPEKAGEHWPLAGFYTGDVMISFAGVSLDIVRPSDDLTLATMDTGPRPTLCLNLQSPPVYFGDTPVGYVFRYGLDFFAIDTQDTPFGLDQEDLGTSVDGFFLYFMPALVLDSTRMHGLSTPGARVGIGLGVGYLSAKGDFITWDIDAPYPYPETRRTIDVSGLGMGGYVFSEYLLGRLVFGLRAGFFNASGGGYDYVVGDYSIDVGFRSRF